jgi:type IV pilus assembly protein PilA
MTPGQPYPQQPQAPYPPQQGPGQQGPPPAKKSFPTCLIVGLVVLALMIPVGGIMASLAIYGVRKYIANSKTAEARNSVGMIAKLAIAAYEKENLSTRGPSHRLCPSASHPIPLSMASVSGKKYQSSPSEWEEDSRRDGGFHCLGFALSLPQYFRYTYRAHGVGLPGDGFEAIAEGDLNGDGVTSRFIVSGQIDAHGTLVVAPNIVETTPEE